MIPITAGNAGVSEVAMVSLLTASAGSAAINEVTAAVILFRLLAWLLGHPGRARRTRRLATVRLWG